MIHAALTAYATRPVRASIVVTLLSLAYVGYTRDKTIKKDSIDETEKAVADLTQRLLAFSRRRELKAQSRLCSYSGLIPAQIMEPELNGSKVV